MLRARAEVLALVFCLLFVAVGSLWISEVGLQNDEALFSAGMYPPFGPSPSMLMSYVGALKSYVYLPIFKVWPPSAASVRFPALVLGGLTIWLFYLLLKRTLDTRTALAGTALIATDTSFLLTSRWDWGPVVLQHLCLAGGVLAVVLYTRQRRLVWLFVGFLAFGLGLWDKAIFAWSLVGLGVAAVAVFPRRTFAALSWRAVAVASLGLATGAAPLILHNLKYDFVTFRQNAGFSSEILGYKARLLLSALDGSGLIGGSIVRDDFEQPIRQPDGVWKRGFVATSLAIGSPRKNWQLYLLGLSILLLPFVWRTSARSAFLFALIYSAVTWAQMAFTHNAGTGLHHPILIWPIPHLGIAAVLAAASRRIGRAGLPLLAGVVGVICCVNLAVTGTYYTNMLRNGGNTIWSDAIYPASEALPSMKPSHVCILDWGFFEQLRLLHRGRISMCVGAEEHESPHVLKGQLEDPDIVFIKHADGQEVEPGRATNFLQRARAQGYEKTSQRIFHDYNGRPIIEVFKLFRPQRR